MAIVAPDRDADAIHDTRAKMAGIAIGVIFTPIGHALALMLGLRGLLILPFVLLCGGTVGFVVRRFVGAISNAAGTAVGRVLMPTGDSSPYARTYSYEQSLAVRGDTAGALSAYEAAMLDNPHDPEPRRQAAELLFRSGSAERATELFADARRLAGDDRATELYATQRLVDLYIGPLANPGRAMVELRRLVERFPATREAAAARELIATLKRGNGDGPESAQR